MASPGSSIRSAARATFSAYRRVPVRWRLGGGSAALTFVILAGFAGVTDVLTDRQLSRSFHAAAVRRDPADGRRAQADRAERRRRLPAADLQLRLRPTGAQIRFFDQQRQAALLLAAQRPDLQRPALPRSDPRRASAYVEDGYQVDTQAVPISLQAETHGPARLRAAAVQPRRDDPRGRGSSSVAACSAARSWRCWRVCSSPSARCARSSS